jgi:hypothetical protein
MGKLNITTEVCMLGVYIEVPKEKQLSVVFHMFDHLKNQYNARLIYDPRYPQI